MAGPRGLPMRNAANFTRLGRFGTALESARIWATTGRVPAAAQQLPEPNHLP
jgi:hypothetical protein